MALNKLNNHTNMSRQIGHLIKIVGLTVLCIGVSLVAGATVRTDARLGCSIKKLRNGYQHICRKGLRIPRSSLDVRAENTFTKRIPASLRKFNFYFSVNYEVRSARLTTIAQLLNADRSKKDVNQPVLFLEVHKVKSNGKLELCMFRTCTHKWDNVPKNFRLQMWMSGNKARVKVAGRRTVTFDLTNGGKRKGGVHNMRWGIYHHHRRSTSTQKIVESTAHIITRNLQSNGF